MAKLIQKVLQSCSIIYQSESNMMQKLMIQTSLRISRCSFETCFNLVESGWSRVCVLLCDSLCSAGKTFIVMEDTETPSFQCKMCQTNASSFHHKVEIISCVLVVLSRLSLQSRSSWQNVSLFSQQKKLHWRIPK